MATVIRLESKASAFLTEGVSVFRRPLPENLAGQTIAYSQLRPRTGCSIVALEPTNGDSLVSPPADTRLEKGITLILIGTPAQEELFDTAIRGH